MYGGILCKYSDVFSGELGSFKGKRHLEVDETVNPVKRPLRRVPNALKLKHESRTGTSKTVKAITPVATPTDWVSHSSVAKLRTMH